MRLSNSGRLALSNRWNGYRHSFLPLEFLFAEVGFSQRPSIIVEAIEPIGQAEQRYPRSLEYNW